MKRSSVAHLECSIARSLELVGEWWSLLVIREVFFGHHRFETMREELGISRNILTDRLNTLVEGGILHRVPVEAGHHEYRLTEKGADLYEVLVAIMQWGDRWNSPGGPPTVLVHSCGQPATPHLHCDKCGEQMTGPTTRLIDGPGRTGPAKHGR